MLHLDDDDEPLFDISDVGPVKKKKLLEKQIEDRVCRYAAGLGWRAMKFVSPNYRSVPDRIFFKASARAFFIEFKREGEVPTPKQKLEIDRLKAEGFDVFVCDDVDFGKTIIQIMSYL